ncbi:MAG: hypothetical protein Q8K70_06850 [Bacteroidota bacterium]|nr:hypothetical protein [Bacteroidota bacterium]
MGTDKFIFKYSKTEYQDIITYIIQTVENENNILNKLPSFHQSRCLINQRSFEQCTSEQVAIFKSKVFMGENLLVLTGGLGIDEWAFCHSYKNVISLDIDYKLNEISRYNFNQLKVNNIQRLDCSAEVFLNQTTEIFDAVYIDPDRRVDGKREFLLQNHQPNILELLPLIKKISRKLLIKCSPLYDFEMAIKEVEGLRACYILSVKGEVKEMLLEVDFFERSEDKIQIKCVDINKENQVGFECFAKDEGIPIKTEFIEPYFYEVGSSIVKVRKHHQYAFKKNLRMIDHKVPFYTSSYLVEDLIGRAFKVIDTLPFSNSKINDYFKKNEITKGNLKVRGLIFKTSDILNKIKLIEGGDDYFFIFPMNGKNIFVHTRKLAVG